MYYIILDILHKQFLSNSFSIKYSDNQYISAKLLWHWVGLYRIKLAGKNEISLKNKPIEIRFLNVYTSLILCSLGNAFSPFSLGLNLQQTGFTWAGLEAVGATA